MDRPLKFRAWDRDSDQMISGFGLTPDDLFPYMIPAGDASDDPANYTYFDNAELMQFTGFLDKNDREIYEGDIVRYTDVSRSFAPGAPARPVIGVNRNFTVVWENGAFTFDNLRTTFWNEIRNPREIPDWDFPKLLEVIGNIYENPDLLENEGYVEAVNG